MKTDYPEWLRNAASKGGRKSRRKLAKAEARRIANIRHAKGKAGLKARNASHKRAL